MRDSDWDGILRRFNRTLEGIRPGDKKRSWIIDQEKLIDEVKSLRGQVDQLAEENESLREQADTIHWFA